MAKLVWDAVGQRQFENGISKGVLYPMSDTPGTYDKGVVWNGLTSVSESPEGGEVTAVYADNIKYFNMMSTEEFKCTIEAYSSPEEFDACDGTAQVCPGFSVTQQTRKLFGLSYQTKMGNDLNPEVGYKIHIVYGCLAAPSEKSYQTINESPEAMTLSWEVSTTPVEVSGFKPTAHVEIDSTKCDAEKLALLEAKLYGSASEVATLLLPDEIVAILGTN